MLAPPAPLALEPPSLASHFTHKINNHWLNLIATVQTINYAHINDNIFKLSFHSCMYTYIDLSLSHVYTFSPPITNKYMYIYIYIYICVRAYMYIYIYVALLCMCMYVYIYAYCMCGGASDAVERWCRQW